MTTRLNEVRRPRPDRDQRVMALLIAGSVLGFARPAAAQLLLPAPEQNPQSIDFSHDPLLAFLAAESDPAPFRAAIAEAVARHPATGEAEAGSDVARQVRREARSALFPSLDASLVGAHSFARDFQGNSTIAEGLVPRGRTDAGVGADQLIYDFGATGGRIGGASARLRGAEADADRATIATSYAAIEAWYQVLGYQSALDLDDALIERHRRILADTRIRVAAGLGAGGDIARAEAGLADAIGASARTARTLANARARYREAFGLEPPARPLRPARPQSAASDAATAMAMAHAAPPVVAALAAAEAARSDARAARGDTLPRITAGVNATMFNVFETGRNYDVRGVLALRQAFSTGGAQSARLAQANARARAAGYAADRVTAEAERDAEAAFADVRILDGSAAALEDAYRANRRSRDTMAEQFRLSRGSLIDLLRSEQEFFAAARALLQGNLERDLAHYALLARTGELPGLFADASTQSGTSR